MKAVLLLRSVFSVPHGNLLCVNHESPGGMEPLKTKRCSEWPLGKVLFICFTATQHLDPFAKLSPGHTCLTQ